MITYLIKFHGIDIKTEKEKLKFEKDLQYAIEMLNSYYREVEIESVRELNNDILKSIEIN